MGKKTKTELEEELAAAKQRIAKLEFRLCNEEADEMFDIAFKRNPLPMWIYDVETLGFLEINNAACLRYGYSRDEFLNMTLLEIRPAEDKDRLVQNVRENKDIYQRSAAWRHKEKGGKIFPVEIISYSVEYRGKDARLVAALDISERKHAEDELRTSEQNYRTLVENSESAIAVINKDGKILYTNPKGMQVWNDSQIVGKTIFDVYPPEYAERYFKAINKVITTQTGLLDDVKTPIKDHLMWFRVSMQPLQNPDGTVDRLLLNAIDITQSKQAQDELRASEERLSSFFENAGSIVWIKDLEGRFIAVNKYTEAVLGWPRERVIDRTVYDLFPKEEADSYTENDRKVLSSGQVIECEETALLGGVLHIYTSTKFPLRDTNGDIYALGAISVDVTEQKQIESALRESEEKFRSLAEELEQRVIDRTNEIKIIQRRLEVATKAAELGIWDWNVNTNQLLFDEQMHVIYGTSPNTFNGTIEGFMKIVHPEDAGSLMSLAQSVLNGEPHYHMQYRIIHSDRSIRHIKAYGTVLYDRQDLPEHIIGVVMDMTQDKVVEETLRLANLELERAMRVKDEFLANMSHELRTPLNSILGISESLEEQVAGQVNEKQKKYLRIISESGRHLLELINDILDLSKIGAGRLELIISQFSAEAACQSSLRMIKELAKKKKLNVSFRLDEKVEYIEGDERRLKQILVNLLSNAVKFTPEGGRLGLEVSGHMEKGQVTFTVWDTGIGITRRDLSRLFKPFVQLDSRLSREASGTGLGLMLVSQLARLHGGKVEVQSEPGRGSRFAVSLPWAPMDGNETAGQLVNEPTLPTANLLEQTTAARILLVEDTEPVILFIKDYLETKGYHITVAHNGYEGVTLAKHLKPDVILMDIQMPSMDGFEATKQIRAEEQLKDVPIIAMTALAMPGDREKCLQAGMNHYMSKPINLKELHSLLIECTTQKGGRIEQ